MDITQITATGVVTNLQTGTDPNNQDRSYVNFLLETRYYENKQTRIVNIPVKGTLNNRALQYLNGANVLINGDFVNGKNNTPVVQLKMYNGLVYAGGIGLKKENNNNNQQSSNRQPEPSGVNNGLPTNQEQATDLPF